MAIDALEVVLFATRAGDCKAKFQKYGESTECEDATDNPEKERYTNGSSNGKNTRRCRENWSR
jgi:hypothetical protein